MSANCRDTRVCHTFHRSISFCSLLNPKIQQCRSRYLSQHTLGGFVFYTRDATLCTVFNTEHLESSLPAEQGVQTQQILFVWGHDPSTHGRRARFLTSVGDLIRMCHCHCHCQEQHSSIVRWLVIALSCRQLAAVCSVIRLSTLTDNQQDRHMSLVCLHLPSP